MGIQSIATSIRVLEALAERQPVGLSELSRSVGVPKATVQRILTTFEELHWIERAPRGDDKWTISIHAYAVTSRGSSGSRIRDAAMGPLSNLQLDIAETMHLAVPDGRQMVIIERLDTSHALRAFLSLGSRVPMHASATGLAFMAHSPESFISDYLAQPLQRSGPNTIVDKSEICAVLESIRDCGYSVNHEGLSAGITAVGSAFRDRSGRPVGSVSISGPSSRITADKFETYGGAIRNAAEDIAALLPY